MNRRSFCTMMLAAFTQLFLFGCARDRAMIRYKDDSGAPELPDIWPPNALVVYDSWSGNTQRIGEAIAGAIGCPVMHLDEINEGSMPAHDLLIIGSPTHGGMPTEKMEEFLETIEKPCISAVFATFGAPFFGPLTANGCLNGMEKRLHGTCIGRFKCHGFHHILRTYPSHPDEEDRENAARFATGLIIRCQKQAAMNRVKLHFKSVA